MDGRYTEQASQQTTGVEICEIPIGSHLIEVMRPFIAGMKVGFEAETISYQTLLNFTFNEGGQWSANRHQNMVESLRMIKSSKRNLCPQTGGADCRSNIRTDHANDSSRDDRTRVSE